MYKKKGSIIDSHKRKLLLTILLLILSLFVLVPAEAFKPQKPYLTLDKSPTLCSPFRKAWAEVFESDRSLDESSLDLKKYYGPSTIIKFPKGGPDTLFDDEYFFEADLNADGSPEHFYLAGLEIGWRYMGAELFIIDNLEELEKKAGIDFEDDSIDLDLEYNQNFKDHSKSLYRYYPPSRVHFLVKPEGLYTFSIPYRPNMTDSSSVELVQLHAEGAQAVCHIELLPAKSKYEDFTKTFGIFDALKNVYGGPQGCMGTMGWTAAPFDTSLSTIFERPHIVMKSNKDDGYRNSDATRKLRYISWAISDPISWSVLQDLEMAEETFVKFLTSYYSDSFDYSKSHAQMLSRRALNYWLDSVVYGRSHDGYTITRAANGLGPSVPNDTKKLVNEVFEAVINKHINPDDNILPDLLLALIYTRSDKDKIIRTYAMIEKSVAERPTWRYEGIIDISLLAAIGEPNLMEISVNQGAQVDAPTNWFQKTPLMYAAQMNELESAKFLIAEGANVNARTHASDDSCMDLSRDHRTPLMYAAESAGEDVIRLLLAAGADITYQDSKGNRAAWYFAENIIISDPGIRANISALLSKKP